MAARGGNESGGLGLKSGQWSEVKLRELTDTLFYFYFTHWGHFFSDREKSSCFKKDSVFMVKIGLKSQRTWGRALPNK